MRQTDTQILVSALRILSMDIVSDDGIANSAIAEAADRLEQYMHAVNQTLEENLHLADGKNCTLMHLKRAIAGNYSPWVKIDYANGGTWPIASKPCVVAWDDPTCHDWHRGTAQTWERLAMRVADGDNGWMWAECFSGDFEDFDPPPTHWCYAQQLG